MTNTTEIVTEDIVFSSDLHLGHRNISAYAGRPFTPEEVEVMNMAIIDTWNSMVSIRTRAYLLGDLAMGKIRETVPLLALLNGYIVFSPGNHDRCWLGDPKTHKAIASRQMYLDTGCIDQDGSSSGICEIDDHPAPMEIAGEAVMLSHFPYKGGGDHTDEERYGAYRLEDHGAWLLHGHVHEKWRQRGRQINVGVDAWGGRPVHITEIEELIKAGPRDLDIIQWKKTL